MICKKVSFDYPLASLCIIFQPNHFPQLADNITKWLVREMESLWNIHHVWNGTSRISEQDWGGCMWEKTHLFVSLICWLLLFPMFWWGWAVKTKELKMVAGKVTFLNLETIIMTRFVLIMGKITVLQENNDWELIVLGRPLILNLRVL